jgi:hypothetical protein
LQRVSRASRKDFVMRATNTAGRKNVATVKATKPRSRVGSTNPPQIILSMTTALSLKGVDLATADIHTLVDLQRKAISIIDNLPHSNDAAEDNATLTVAIEPVMRIFTAIKALTPDHPADIALQMTAIAELAEWYAAEADAMEDISVPEFRRLANNLASALSPCAPTKNPLGMIDATLGPLGFEPDLMAEVRRLRDVNDVRGMLALFEAYRDVAEMFIKWHNMPRSKDLQILEDEFSRAWSKAYIVAEYMKQMRPDPIEKERVAEALFSCALMMGHSLSDAIAVVQAIAIMPGATVLAANSMPDRTDPRKAGR